MNEAPYALVQTDPLFMWLPLVGSVFVLLVVIGRLLWTLRRHDTRR